MQFEVFYDGDCPLCMKEISMLQWMDKKKGNILFTDIAVPGFDAVETTGLTMDDLMAEIYGRLPSGELVKGMEVFRQLYGAVGLGALFAPTAWRPLRPLFDAIYTGFAKNRLRMTGRCTDEVCATAPQ
jgi:predicted DCC family thiol-disulfide oxidoreductase YuxK